MNKILREVLNALEATINQIGMQLWDLFDDMPVMSHEAQLILSHKEDREKFIEAVESIKNGGEVTITLHNGKEITLFRQNM